jgi:hypothetical protein
VDRLRLELPSPNTYVKARLFSADAAEGPWQQEYQGPLFRLKMTGEELSGPEISLYPRQARFYRLQVLAEGGGLGRGRPVLRLSTIPLQLFFVARGKPPFWLAYGRAAATPPSAFTAEELQNLIPPASRERLWAEPATLGPRIILAGETALHPMPPPLPWKKWLLWAALLLGVLLLAWMSYRLLRQVNREA